MAAWSVSVVGGRRLVVSCQRVVQKQYSATCLGLDLEIQEVGALFWPEELVCAVVGP